MAFAKGGGVNADTTVAVLYPGDMGMALAAALRAKGFRVATTLAGRSQRTADNCRAGGIVVLDSFAEVVRQSQIVISCVLPEAAPDIVAQYCAHAHLAPGGAVFVEANSIGPEAVRALAGKLARCGIDFVDAAINGLAANLMSAGTVFLSGGRANEVARLFEAAFCVRVLGEQPGRASAMKMLLSGVSKGICALFLELAVFARRQGMSPEFLRELARIYPGIADVINRILPTYARHAQRRATEMNELEQTMRSAGLEPCVVESVRRLHEALAAAVDTSAGAGSPSVETIVEHLAAGDLLASGVLTALQERAF
jgi:3-hydroxyisobutyrate dehydrogenase-like beta-hydroxyacid dehydrogenase